MGKRKQYTEEFKKDAVRLMLGRGTRTVEDVAAGLGIHTSLLYRWHQQYGSEVTGRPAVSEKEREDVERLRRLTAGVRLTRLLVDCDPALR